MFTICVVYIYINEFKYFNFSVFRKKKLIGIKITI